MSNIDFDKPRWRAGDAAAIAGILVNQLPMVRIRSGVSIGILKDREHLFSVVDVAELTAYVALRALGLPLPEAARKAHALRPELKDLFVNRLVHGFWSIGAYEVSSEGALYRRVLYFDAIGERVITKLQLPLPVRPRPCTPQVAVRMVDAIMNYFEQPPGIKRWNDWHAAVIKQASPTWDDAAAVLGAPVWFLQALINAVRDMPKDDDTPIIKAVRPRAKAEWVADVTLH